MKNATSWKSGAWRAECLGDDGARLSRLCFKGKDLLTRAPERFQAPRADYGLYETRPVYGYDDCWPTVDVCYYPENDLQLADHGELCWMPWKVEILDDDLVCTVQSRKLCANYQRRLHAASNVLEWHFEVHNFGKQPLFSQAVMHALMPCDSVTGIGLPNFAEAVDEMTGEVLNLHSATEVAHELLKIPNGTARMLLLRSVRESDYRISFNHGFKLHVKFPASLFDTVGIWWNKDGYPDEDGLRRNECAFEPISGPGSSLTAAYEAGKSLCVEPGQTLSWSITWSIEESSL